MRYKKIITVVLCAVAVLIPFAAGRAQTAAELMDQVQGLQDQLVKLQDRLEAAAKKRAASTTSTTSTGTKTTAETAEFFSFSSTSATSTPAACSGIVFNRNLSLGSNGTDVKCLQAILNLSSDTRVAAAGSGSPGNETMYYGPLTRMAVIRFQNKYAGDILTPTGLVSGTGFVGAATRTKLNSMLSQVSGANDEIGSESENNENSDEDNDVISGTGGSLDVAVNPTPANETRIYEGESKIDVLGIKVTAGESGLTVNRIALNFGPVSPSDFLSAVYVYDGGMQKAAAVLDDPSITKVGSDYYVTLTGINGKIDKESSKVFTVKVDAPGMVSQQPVLPKNITISVPAGGIRGTDSAGDHRYGPEETVSISRTFSVNAMRPGEARLIISMDPGSPLPRNISAGEDNRADGVIMLVFSIATQRDSAKITGIKNIVFGKTADTEAVYPETAYLIDDSGGVIGISELTQNHMADFNDLDIAIEKDTTKVFGIAGDYTNITNPMETGRQNTTIATVNSGANIIAANSAGRDIPDSDKTGSAASYPMYFYQNTPNFTLSKVTSAKTPASSSGSAKFDAVFTVKVQAGGGDIMIPKNGGFEVKRVEIGDVEAASANGVTVVYDQPAETTVSGNNYVILQNSSAVFTVKAELDTEDWNSRPGFYDLRIAKVNWVAAVNGQTINNFTTYTLGDFKSDTAFLP